LLIELSKWLLQRVEFDGYINAPTTKGESALKNADSPFVVGAFM